MVLDQSTLVCAAWRGVQIWQRKVWGASQGLEAVDGCSWSSGARESCYRNILVQDNTEAASKRLSLVTKISQRMQQCVQTFATSMASYIICLAAEASVQNICFFFSPLKQLQCSLIKCCWKHQPPSLWWANLQEKRYALNLNHETWIRVGVGFIAYSAI